MDMTKMVNVITAEKPALATVDLGIAGMTGARCVRKIEKALQGKTGVKTVRIDRSAGIARITFDPRQTHVPDLHDLLLQSGYHPARTAD